MPITVEVVVEGGRASPGPPLGPAIGPLGLNVMQVVKAINEATKDFEGMKIPVKIVVEDPTKGKFRVEVGTPLTSALILKELGKEKGSSEPGRQYIGDLPFEKVVKVARLKMKGVPGTSLKSMVLQVLGTCQSMGVMVDGRPPKEVIRLVKEGAYEDKLGE